MALTAIARQLPRLVERLTAAQFDQAGFVRLDVAGTFGFEEREHLTPGGRCSRRRR